MAFDPWAGANQGLSSFNNSMLTLAQLKRQDAEDAQRSNLVDLQTQAAQQSVDQNKITLADLAAKQGALIDQYGTAGHADPLSSAYSFQQQEGQDAATQEAKQKGFQIYLNTLKSLEGVNLDPETKTKIGKHFLAQNPEYAPFAENLKYIDSKGVKAARMFQEGELKDPVTKQPLPAGYYETEGRWTGDAANPVELLSYKQAEPPKNDKETWEEPYETVVGGKRVMLQKSSTGQIKPVVQDTSTTVKLSTGGGGHGGGSSSGHGGGTDAPKPPKPGKVLPAGQLESIADMKRVKDVLAEASDDAFLRRVETGPVVGRGQAAGAKFGLASDGFVTVQQKLQTAENIMLKLRSGAAVTESEYERFRKEFPSPNDSPEVFRRKMDNTLNYATTLMDDKLSIYEEGGYRIPQSVKSGGQSPASAPAAAPKAAVKPAAKGKAKNASYDNLLSKHEKR